MDVLTYQSAARWMLVAINSRFNVEGLRFKVSRAENELPGRRTLNIKPLNLKRTIKAISN
jgi:hypothetical protein